MSEEAPRGKKPLGTCRSTSGGPWPTMRGAPSCLHCKAIKATGEAPACLEGPRALSEAISAPVDGHGHGRPAGHLWPHSPCALAVHESLPGTGRVPALRQVRNQEMGSVSAAGDQTKALERLSNLTEVLRRPEIQAFVFGPRALLHLWGNKIPDVQIPPNFQTFTLEQSFPCQHRQACGCHPPWAGGPSA